MKNPKGALLLLEGDRCRLTRTEDGRMVVQAGEISRLEVNPAQVRNVVIGLRSEACLCHTAPTDGLPSRGRRQALLYRAEEHLPLPAEDVAADFIIEGRLALEVCVPVQAIEPVLHALSVANVGVAAICPAAVLDLQAAARAPEARDLFRSDAILLQREGCFEFFTLARGRPISWQTIPDDPADLCLLLARQVLSRQRGLSLSVLNIAPERLRQIRSLPDVTVAASADLPLTALALAAAQRIAGGEESSWLDLRPSATARAGDWLRVRRCAIAAAASLLLCASCAVGACLWRAGHYARDTRRNVAETESVYRDLFPGQPVPIGINSRLQSVTRQLSGAAVQTSSSGRDALRALYDVLSCVPRDASYRLTSLEADPTRVTLQGEAASHSEPDTLAASLRGVTGLTVEDPQTEQGADQSVKFSIEAIAGSAAEGRRGRP